MSTVIYVNNLPFDTTSEELRVLFCTYGIVETVALISDRQTGRPCGFGFVGMMNGANEAIAALNNMRLRGNRLDVKFPATWWQTRSLKPVQNEN